MYNFLREEGFTLSKKQEKELTVISMTSPGHLSCKEFTVHYDSTAKQVKRIFFRQADIMDHMNPDMEKWVTLVFREWNDDPDVTKYLQTDKFVVQHNGQPACTAAFRNYELIVR